MAQLKKSRAYRTFVNTAVPYRSFINPLTSGTADTLLVPGSQNVLTSPKGYAERRYGFANALESTPTVFNNLQRIFSWNTFSGQFIQMACDINSSGFAQVYKMVQGVDASFVSLFTDTTANVFDFSTSNNTCYFSNGNVAKAWNPTRGLTNWGLSIGAVNTSVTQIAGTGADAGGGGPTWTNPGNVTSATNFATCSITTSGGFGLGSDGLNATGFSFAVGSTSQIFGIQVQFDEEIDADPGAGNAIFEIQMLKGGNLIGTLKASGDIRNTSPSTLTFGGSSDLWGTTWTANDINASNFGVQIIAFLGSTPQTRIFSVRNVKITVFTTGGPTISVSGSAGSLSAVTGYQYVFCYGNSISGHVSSPSPVSASTGVFTSKANVQVSLTASTDAQVDQIRVFRSTDSVAAGAIAANYFELPNSPFSNTTQNINDTAADSSLVITSIAPYPGFNDPPTPGFSPTVFSGRIWLFKNNQVFFSDLEECVNGVPEESFTSGVAGNFYNFDQPVTGLAVAGTGVNQTLMIYCGGKIYGITGNSLDTFRRFLITERRGMRNRTNVSSLGGLVAWVDTSTQVWGTDGTQLIELGLDIRTDLKAVNQQTCDVTFHTSGELHVLMVSTGTQIFVLDIDTQYWMPPWTVALNYLCSYETTSGVYSCIGAFKTKATTLDQSGAAAKYNDNGSTYQPIFNFALKPMVQDYNIYSLKYGEIASQPGQTWYLNGVDASTNITNPFADVLVMADDDPTQSSTVYNSIAKNLVTPQTAYNSAQGVNIIQNIYTANKEAEGKMVGLKIKGQNAADSLRLYRLFIGVSPLGG